MTDVVKTLESCPGCRKKADEIKKHWIYYKRLSPASCLPLVWRGRAGFSRNAMMNCGKPVVSAAPFLSVAAAVVVCAGLAF